MRRRIRSSIGVVIVGLVPVLIGGPVFAALIAFIVFVSWKEFANMALRLTPVRLPISGLIGSLALVLVGWLNLAPEFVTAILILTFMATFIVLFPQSGDSGALASAATTIAGVLYLGLPAYTAIALRGFPDGRGLGWSTEFQSLFAGNAHGLAPGLAWVLVVVLATWAGDSTAYLTGRAWGRRRLAPTISPGKTWEGAAGGLAGAMLVCVITLPALGLSSLPLVAAGVGVILGISGQLGDLTESFVKRQVGVKDSGTLIPGHGGMLDRIDALWFALPAGWVIANIAGT